MCLCVETDFKCDLHPQVLVMNELVLRRKTGMAVDGPFFRFREHIKNSIFLTPETELWNPYHNFFFYLSCFEDIFLYQQIVTKFSKPSKIQKNLQILSKKKATNTKPNPPTHPTKTSSYQAESIYQLPTSSTSYPKKQALYNHR